jgi:hypothetical protein
MLILIHLTFEPIMSYLMCITGEHFMKCSPWRLKTSYAKGILERIYDIDTRYEIILSGKFILEF